MRETKPPRTMKGTMKQKPAALQIKKAFQLVNQDFDKPDEGMYSNLYASWCLAPNAWSRLGFGSTFAMRLLWLHRIKHPKSKEWRPAFVIAGVVS